MPSPGSRPACRLLWSSDKLTSDSPELAQALKQFPGDSAVTQLAVRCAGDKELTRDLPGGASSRNTAIFRRATMASRRRIRSMRISSS